VVAEEPDAADEAAGLELAGDPGAVAVVVPALLETADLSARVSSSVSAGIVARYCGCE